MTKNAPDFAADFIGQLDSLLRWRRDVRHFLSQPVDDTDLGYLFQAAGFAPSVGNAQPWRFARLRSPQLREQLAGHVDGCIAASAPDQADSERRQLYRSLKLHGIREAPELVAVFSDSAPLAGHRLGRATMPETLRYSTVMAIHSMWLAARARGIGLGWVSILDPRLVTAMLDVPDSWELVAILCIGYPAAPSAVPELELRGWQDRESMDERIVER